MNLWEEAKKVGQGAIEVTKNAVDNAIGAGEDLFNDPTSIENWVNAAGYINPVTGPAISLYDYLNKEAPLPDLPITSLGDPINTSTIKGLIEAQRIKLLKKENEARSILGQQTKSTGEAIETRMTGLLEDLDIQANETRQLVGSTFGQRGLDRSTFKMSKLNQLEQELLSQKAGVRSEAERQRAGVQETTQKTLQGISDKRVSAMNRLRDLELQGLNDLSFLKEQEALRLDFEKYIAGLDISSLQKNALMGVLGTAGALGGMYAGTKLGSTPTPMPAGDPSTATF